jgi:hypothetical protein
MTWRYAFRVDDPEGPRWRDALRLLADGDFVLPIVVCDVGLSLDQPGKLVASVESTWSLDNVTGDTARRDLTRAQSVVAALIESSPEFAALVAGRTLEYHLIHDDGMVSIGLCSMDAAGDLLWQPGCEPLRS